MNARVDPVLLDAVSDGEFFALIQEGSGILERIDEDSPTFFEDFQRGREILAALEAIEAASAGDPQAFIQAPSGGVDFGRIPPLGSRLDPGKTYPEAPIRMEEGGAYGKQHIAPDRLSEFHDNGYQDAAAFLQDVGKHFTHVYEQPNGRLLLVKRNGRAKFAAVELQLKAERYYGVTTLFLEDANPRGKPYETRGGRVLLWPVAQATQSGTDAPFPAATNEAGVATADAREGNSSVDPPLRNDKTSDAPDGKARDRQEGVEPSGESEQQIDDDLLADKISVSEYLELQGIDQDEPTVTSIARSVLGDRFEATTNDLSKVSRLAREKDIPHESMFIDGRHIADVVADANLLAAPDAKISARIAALEKNIDGSLEGDRGGFDPGRIGGRSAAGRQRDRARSSEARHIMRGKIQRLQDELDRRSTLSPLRKVPGGCRTGASGW